MNKNKNTLKQFTFYCELHPEMRFWQALRNFMAVDKIYLEVYDEKVDDVVLKDTFYIK